MILKDKPFIILSTHCQKHIPIDMRLLIAIIILMSTAINLVDSESHSVLKETRTTTTKSEAPQDIRMPSSDEVKAYFGDDKVKVTEVKTQEEHSESRAVSIIDIIKLM